MRGRKAGEQLNRGCTAKLVDRAVGEARRLWPTVNNAAALGLRSCPDLRRRSHRSSKYKFPVAGGW